MRVINRGLLTPPPRRAVEQTKTTRDKLAYSATMRTSDGSTVVARTVHDQRLLKGRARTDCSLR